MTEPPPTWNTFPAYIDQRELCRGIEVINDCAERAIKDCQAYAKSSCSPELRESLITVAQDHRGRATTVRKGGLFNM